MRIQRFTANSIALVLLASLSNLSLAQESVATTTTNSQPTWLRDIALSPDGQRIAFTYAGQIWLIASKGEKPFLSLLLTATVRIPFGHRTGNPLRLRPIASGQVTFFW